MILVELQDIVSVLALMKRETNKTSIQRLQDIFRKMSTLWEMVSEHLNERKHQIDVNEFALIQQIFFRYYNPFYFYTRNPQEYLLDMLSRADNPNIDYLTSWFNHFLCDSRPNWIDYRALLQQWTHCFRHDRSISSKILQQIDMFIDQWINVVPEDVQHTNYFVEHMVNQCFQQSKRDRISVSQMIIELLRDDLHSVQNEKFIEIFTKTFERETLRYPDELLNNLSNSKNPLHDLLIFDKEPGKSNLLVKSLLRLITSSITLTSLGVITDAFYDPSSDTLTYAALFNPSLQALPIHQEILKHLQKQWEIWQNGVRPDEISIWSKFNQRQKIVTQKIWSVVIGTSEEHQLDALFDTNYREMQNKLAVSEKVVTCLNVYCTKACDKDECNAVLGTWHNTFQSSTVRSIQMPRKLEELLPYAERLNPYSNVSNWCAFLQTHRYDYSERKSCLEILHQTYSLFKRFLGKIDEAYTSRQKIPLEELLKLFPHIREAENDLHLLQIHLNPEVRNDLLAVFSFSKHHGRISHLCQGLIKLSSHFSATINRSFYERMRSVDTKTSIQIWIELYQQYRNELETRFLDKVLIFISYYSSSADLFEFLHILTDDDISSLKEASNDRGETSTDAETIFDFGNIKSFMDRTYDMIKDKQLRSILSIDLVIQCFEQAWKQEQTVDLLKCLESSSLSLTSIKHTHLTLNNKEQSKRRRISDILQQSTVIFVRVELHEVSFDVNVQLPIARR